MFNKEELMKEIKQAVIDTDSEGVIVRLKGDIESSVLAVIAKEAVGDKLTTIMIDIEATQSEWRNGLRIVEMIKPEDIRISLTDEYEALIKKVFEVKDIYKDPETYQRFLETGESPVDDSYLNEEVYETLRYQIKESLIKATLDAWSTRKNYLVLEGLDETTKEELIEVTKELNIPEMVVKTNEEE